MSTEIIKKNIWHKWIVDDNEFYALSPQKKSKYIPLPDGKNEQLETLNKHASSVNKVFPQIGVVELYRDEDDMLNDGMELPSGCYQYIQTRYGSPPSRFVPITLRTDEYIKVEGDGVYAAVSAEIDSFLNSEQLYKELNAIYKRAVLLYGVQGSGKTSLIRYIINEKLIPLNPIVVSFTSVPDLDTLKSIAKSLDSRLKIFIFEELLSFISTMNSTQDFLEFLDGEKSLSKTFMFGTTNYPEKLPANIADRPSRWDTVINVDLPSEKVMPLILGHYLNREATETEVKLIKGMTSAAIKEVCFMHHLHKLPFDEAVKRSKERTKLVKAEFAKPKASMGFGGSKDDF